MVIFLLVKISCCGTNSSQLCLKKRWFKTFICESNVIPLLLPHLSNNTRSHQFSKRLLIQGFIFNMVCYSYNEQIILNILVHMLLFLIQVIIFEYTHHTTLHLKLSAVLINWILPYSLLLCSFLKLDNYNINSVNISLLPIWT